MQFHVLGYLGIVIFSGLLFGRIVKKIKLPNVTGYLIAGLVIGPCVLGLIPKDLLTQFDIISEVALGFIAFSIGSEFQLSYLKKIGMTPIVIAVFEALGAVLLVFLGLIAIGQEISFSIVLAAIAAATAPAATIMVVNQYKAKGPVTSTLLTVVAVDDAIALMAFGICVAVANMINGQAENVAWTIAKPLVEIIGALAIGAALGCFLLFPLKFFKKSGNRLSIIVGTIFIGVALADLLGLSSLLLCMALGSVFVNLSRESNEVMKVSEMVTPPIYLMFFVISGAELDISVLAGIGLIGVVYLVLRVAGKIGGAALGAVLMKAEKNVVKYLGFSLLPQAGVAIGLSLVATTVVPEYGATIRAVILCGTLIYELVGPVITKIALKKAGEISLDLPKPTAKASEKTGV